MSLFAPPKSSEESEAVDRCRRGGSRTAGRWWRPWLASAVALLLALALPAAVGAQQDARGVTPAGAASAARTKRDIASDPKTPAATLQELSRDASADVRSAVAQNPSAPPELLEVLGGDAHPGVRSAVARSPITTELVLWRLSTDRDAGVRRALVDNPNTRLPRHAARLLLMDLASDRDLVVRLGVAHNPHLRAALMLLSHDANARVRSAVALNPSTPEEFLWKLSKDPDAGVRSAAAENPKTAAALQKPEEMEAKYREYVRRTSTPRPAK